MANKMLIDASHPEETRVVVLRGSRVEDFDFESADKKQLRGNIYLAKVTRVEPSLQAAFIEYGGNRHGFLAFSEIHPDYYQIPVADRQALLDDEARAHAEADDEEQRPQRRSRRNRNDRGRERTQRSRDDVIAGPIADASVADHGAAEGAGPLTVGDAQPVESQDEAATAHDSGFEAQSAAASEDESAAPPQQAQDAPQVAMTDADAVVPAPVDEPAPHIERDDVEQPSALSQDAHAVGDDAAEPFHKPLAADAPLADEPAAIEPHGEDGAATSQVADELAAPDAEEHGDDEPEEEVVEQVGGDAMDEAPIRAPRSRRQYKIQEVIKRRQVLLVQVVKEERGTKGAALTTYLSLAGRYSVLMPNTARGGGISRKITDAGDRKRLKDIVQDLEVPEGMGIILRTAGASRTKPEVRRDFEYLLRMWETVRELTLKSSAPTLVYEEGSLIKRSIRDLYNKDVEEICVAGEAGYIEARDFMRLLMPSHVKNVIPWSEPQAIFAKSGVELQLDAMYSSHVTLKSGGYLVINQTEALVAIDVNSGRSTREHNIEDTALRTNLEAADEVARQLRLRDLAGLIVVDFIDMEESRNNRAVEKRMKDALRNDRARIQIGRISHFGLLEMSRQRIRTGVLEGSTVVCPHCAGSGMVRSTSSVALHVLRVLEDALVKTAAYNITLRARLEAALYILNHKRAHLHDLELRFGVTVSVVVDETLAGGVHHAIERNELASGPVAPQRPEMVRIDSITPEFADEGEELEDDGETGEDEAGAGSETTTEDGDAPRKRRRRRRRGRGERDGAGAFMAADEPQPTDQGLAMAARITGSMPESLAEASLSDGESDEFEAETAEPNATGGDEAPAREGEPRRRRARRGGRNRGRSGEREPSYFGGVDKESGAPEGDALASPASEGASEPTSVMEQPSTSDHLGSVNEPVAVSAGEAASEPAAVAVVAAEPSPVSSQGIEPTASLEAAPEPKPEPPPAHPAPLPEAEIDPDRPKRAGWWQRAKQSISGGS